MQTKHLLSCCDSPASAVIIINILIMMCPLFSQATGNILFNYEPGAAKIMSEVKSNGNSSSERFLSNVTTTSDLSSEFNLVKLKDSFQPPNSSSIMLIDNLKDTRHFQHKMCTQDSSFKTLNLTVENSFSTKQDFQLDFFNCSENMKGLEISGPLSLNNLHQILTQFRNIEYLSISKPDICTRTDQDLDYDDDQNSDLNQLPTMSKLHLENLKFLKISNMSYECVGLYSFLTQVVLAPNVQTLLLDNVTILITNLELWNKFPISFPRLQTLLFSGKLCPNCQLFSPLTNRKNIWTELSSLNFQVISETDELNINALKSLENFFNLMSDEQLLYLSSNIQFPTPNLFLRFYNLRYLNVSLQMSDSSTLFSVRFFTKFPLLKESDVKLLFSEKSECKVNSQKRLKVTNLSKYLSRSLIDNFYLRSNCKITAVKGWALPCREYSFEYDKSKSMRSVQLSRCPNCTLSGCMR